MKAVVWASTLAQIHEYPCALPDLSDDERRASGCDGVCEHRAGELFGHEFEACPLRLARRDPQIRGVLELERMSRLGLLTGDLARGDFLAAWVPWLWDEYRSELAKRVSQEAQ